MKKSKKIIVPKYAFSWKSGRNTPVFTWKSGRNRLFLSWKKGNDMFERKIGSYIRTFNKTSSNALLIIGVRQIEETLYKKGGRLWMV